MTFENDQFRALPKSRKRKGNGKQPNENDLQEGPN